VAVGDGLDEEAGAHDLDVAPRPRPAAPDRPDSSDLDVSDQRFPLALSVLAAAVALAAVLLVGRRRMAGVPGTAASGDAVEPERTEDLDP
jgi:hypothetical protein